jgi:N-acetylmuramic acid 6-phosphate (MurNAc-6-P) etherase
VDPRLTEQRNPRSTRIDQLSSQEIVDLINAEDRMIAEAVGEERDEIAHAIDIVVDCFQRGGRLFWQASGTPSSLASHFAPWARAAWCIPSIRMRQLRMRTCGSSRRAAAKSGGLAAAST